jgi:hypothetical protein
MLKPASPIPMEREPIHPTVKAPESLSSARPSGPSPTETRNDDGALPLAPPELALVWVDLCDTAPKLLWGARRQVQDLLLPAGLRVSARSVTAAASFGPPVGVRVVLLGSDPSRRGDARPVAGAARTEYDRQLAVWVFPPAVAGGLGLDIGREPLWTAIQKLQFSRALAVVVLHELAHALVGAKHRPHGLMSARLDRSSLLDPRLTVDADLHPALRAAVAARLGADPADAAAGALTRPQQPQQMPSGPPNPRSARPSGEWTTAATAASFCAVLEEPP